MSPVTLDDVFVFLVGEEEEEEGMVVAVVSAGLSLGEDAVFYRIEHKLQDIMVSSPVPSIAYMGGLALSQLMFSMPSLVILAGLVVVLGGMPLFYVPLFVAMMLLLWAAMSSIGFFVASRISHQRTTYQVISAINIGVLVSPVYYSMDIVPEQLHYLAYLVPTTHASLILQYMTGLPPRQNGRLPWALPRWLRLWLSFCCLRRKRRYGARIEK